jgi:anti-sigma factor RsiW
MNCNKTTQNLIFLAEGSLSPELAAVVHAHLANCKKCSHVYQEILQTLAVIETEKQLKVDPWFAGRVEQQFINIRTKGKSGIFELRPVFSLIRILPVAASLAIALWLGIFIGTELSPQLSSGEKAIDAVLYFDLVAEDIYDGSFEAFFLTNGDN